MFVFKVLVIQRSCVLGVACIVTFQTQNGNGSLLIVCICFRVMYQLTIDTDCVRP